MNLNHVWEKHKKFLTQVVGGLAIFLILFYVASSMQSSAADERETIASDNDRLQQQVGKLSLGYSRETSERKTLETRRDDLLGRLSIAENSRIRPPAPEKHSDVLFKEEVERVYSSFEDRANRAGIDRPNRKDFRFRVDSSLSAQEWNDRYVQLDVLERFLNAAVDRRVRTIEEIDPGEVSFEPVPANDDLAIHRFPVEVKFTSSYPTLLLLLESFQKDQEFISVDVKRVEKAEGRAELVEATVELCGVHLGEARETGRRKSGGRGFGGRGRK